MAEFRQKSRGSTADLDGIVGAAGMISIDMSRLDIRVFDGVTLGGTRIPNITYTDNNYVSTVNDTTIDSAITFTGDVNVIATTNPFLVTGDTLLNGELAINGDVIAGAQVVKAAAATASNHLINRGEADARFVRTDASNLDAIIATVLDRVWPVNSLYISTSAAAADNPNVKFAPQVWERIGEGRAVVGAGTADGMAWTAGQLFGTVNHTLTAAQLPAHTHSVSASGTSGSAGDHNHDPGGLSGTAQNAGNHTHSPGNLQGTSGVAGAHGHTLRHGLRFAADGGLGPNFVGEPMLPLGASGQSGIADRIDMVLAVGNHAHFVALTGGATGSAGTHSHSVSITAGTTGQAGVHAHTVVVSGSTGGGSGLAGEAHNNVQPSRGYMTWRRVS